MGIRVQDELMTRLDEVEAKEREDLIAHTAKEAKKFGGGAAKGNQSVSLNLFSKMISFI